VTELSWRGTKDGRVLVDWRGRTVVTLAGSKASRFLAEVESADPEAEQLLLARVTGNFKRGNER
jgi:hypothetical protein